MSDEVTQAFATLRRHLPASLRAQGAALEAAWFNGGPLHRRTRETTAPEGVDAADEQDAMTYEEARAKARELGTVFLRLASTCDERGRELTAAQAANQRVRDLHRRHDDDPGGPPYCAECTSEYAPWPCPTVRALDGDTTGGEH